MSYISQCVPRDAMIHCGTLCFAKDKRRARKAEINLGNTFEGH